MILGHGRSGTTWLGRIISAARRVLYYFEPMHPYAAGTDGLSNWFRYERPGEEDAAMARAFDPVFAGLPAPGKAWNRRGWHRWVPGYRVAVKDVASLMAAEWLYERYRPQMVFIVRHPCPVILSELRQGVPPQESLTEVLAQENLVADHLQAYDAVLRAVDGPIEQLAAVWAARHRVIANGINKHPMWHVAYYEELCADPVTQFRQLIKILGLRWSETMETYVNAHSGNSEEGLYTTKRESRGQIDRWTAHMADSDVKRVRGITEALDIPFYRDDEAWSLAKFIN